MEQFCKDIIEFLQSEYNDAYTFKLERYLERYCAQPPQFKPFNIERLSLIIDITPVYRKIITDDSLQYIFKLYLEDEFLDDRKQYLWQKELVDMIEGS